jgi:hypothetical protein
MFIHQNVCFVLWRWCQDKALDCAIREMEPEFSADKFAPDAADLCRRLLDKDPSSRLGAHGGSFFAE